MTQGEALTILKTGVNVFLTGEPGSGKTHTVNEYVAWLRSAGVEPAITAATGIAATHIGGMTIHSWSGIGVASSLSRADVDRIASKEHVARRIARAKVLIIDEVSMLSVTTFEMVNAVCREVRRVDEPFGGLIVVLVGDFFQLPPVVRRSASDEGLIPLSHSAVFAYASSVWNRMNICTCYLTEQYRQDDAEFLALLAAIRSGSIADSHRASLLQRQHDEKEAPEDVPKLFSHNADVDRLNAAALAKLPGTSRRFHMISKGKESLIAGLTRGCLSPEVLELKEGAAVMFTKNSPQGKFVNGTLGVVSGWGTNGLPIVKTKDGLKITVEPTEWRLEDQGKVRASITQVPLRLAYAMTVHKSQGMSMDAAVMDLSRTFEYGQGYVALSRVRRFSGLHLLGLNERALEVHQDILQKDGDFRAASDAAQETFSDMPQDELLTLQKNFIKAIGGAFTHQSIRKGTVKKGILRSTRSRGAIR